MKNIYDELNGLAIEVNGQDDQNILNSVALWCQEHRLTKSEITGSITINLFSCDADYIAFCNAQGRSYSVYQESEGDEVDVDGRVWNYQEGETWHWQICIIWNKRDCNINLIAVFHELYHILESYQYAPVDLARDLFNIMVDCKINQRKIWVKYENYWFARNGWPDSSYKQADKEYFCELFATIYVRSRIKEIKWDLNDLADIKKQMLSTIHLMSGNLTGWMTYTKDKLKYQKWDDKLMNNVLYG
jgi:hypothetical protein